MSTPSELERQAQALADEVAAWSAKARAFLERPDSQFQPGDRVVVYGSHHGTVESPLDLVRVKLDGFEHAVDFPRVSVSRENGA